MSIKETAAWVEEIPRKLSNQGNEIARVILKEIEARLGF